MHRKTYPTPRLIIRPFRHNDFTKWLEFGREVQPQKNEFDYALPKGFCWNRVTFNKILRNAKIKANKDRAYLWIIWNKKTKSIIGFLDIYIIQRNPIQNANLGYRIDNNHWPRGYAKEALRTFIPAALRDLRLQRLEAVIDIPNKASQALARSVGLDKEGIRKKYYYQNKDWHDQVVYVAQRSMYGLSTLHCRN